MGPDVAVVLALPGDLARPGYRTRTPELVIEIVSPSDRHTQVVLKANTWRAGGARIVWVIDPGARVVHVYTSTGVREFGEDERLDGGDVLPGLQIVIAELFAGVTDEPA
jgi:Uma2 family endonuclease